MTSRDPADSTRARTAAELADAGRSRLAILCALPAGQRWSYFRDQLMVRTLTALAGLAAVIFLAVQFALPSPKPALYVAVINGTIDTATASALQTGAATALNLPEGRESGVLVDDYFDLDKDGLAKLQTMLGNGEIDVIIADRDDFATLAGYGYMTDLDGTLTANQHTALAGSITEFAGFDDRDTDDPEYNGSGRGAAEPFGVNLTGFDQWRHTTGASTETDTADAGPTYIGLAQESANRANAQRFIDYLRG